MKELDSFTVERLEGWLEVATKDGPWRNMEVCSGMLTDLLNIALAAKRAEPVGYWNDACDLDDGAFSYANDAGCTRPLYTTPQLNSQVPLGSWINCSDQMPDSKTGVLVAREFDREGDWRMKWATYVPGHPDARDGWLIPGASWKPTHWMPLPAAPEKP